MDNEEGSCAPPLEGASLWPEIMARVQRALCSVLDLDSCHTASPASHHTLGSDLLVASLLIIAAVLAAMAAASLVARLMYWLNARHGSRVAKVAAAALRQLRRGAPELHPPSRHSWFGARDVDVASPLLCVACLGYIPPLAPGQTLQSCACCGVVAHDACVRHVGDTCRPLSLPAPRAPHFWLTAGTSREEAVLVAAEDGGGAAPAARRCLYCGEPGAGEVYAAEPAWRCACCGVLAHVQCFCDAHPTLPASVAATLEAPSKPTRRAGAAKSAAAGGEATARGARIDGAERATASAPTSPAGSPARPNFKRARSWASGLNGIAAELAEEEPGGAGGGSATAAAGADDGVDAQRQLLRQRRRRVIQGSNVGSLDACSLGPLG
jgi:hypothetical protein